MFDGTTKLTPNNIFRVASGNRTGLVPPIGTTFIDNSTGYWYVGDDVTSGGVFLAAEGADVIFNNISGNSISGSNGVFENISGGSAVFGDYAGNNHTHFNRASGFMQASGAAVMWDDLKFPFTQTKRGSLLKPDFDFTNVGLLFPQNDPDEKIYAIGQFPHARKSGTNIDFHLHWTQSNATYPTWYIEYLWYDNGDQIPAWTTVSGTSGIFPYVSGDMSQITDIADVDGSAITGVSSILKLIIYRNDNDLAGDALADEFDVHFQIDSLGSDQEYLKTF